MEGTEHFTDEQYRKLQEVTKEVQKEYNIPENIFNKKQIFGSYYENNIQPIIREFSFIVDKSITIQDIVNAYKDKLIIDISILDIYEDEKIGNNKKSVSLRYLIQGEKTLIGDEIVNLENNIINAIKYRYTFEVDDFNIIMCILIFAPTIGDVIMLLTYIQYKCKKLKKAIQFRRLKVRIKVKRVRL